MAKAVVDIDFASHYREWDEFRKQGRVQSALTSMGDRIAAQATANAHARGAHHQDPLDDSDFWVNGIDVGSRYAVYVGTSSAEAKVAEMYHSALRDALYAGAGEY